MLRRADAHVVLSSAFRRVLVERYRVRAVERARVGARASALERFTPGDRERARARAAARPGARSSRCARGAWCRAWASTQLLDAWARARARAARGLAAAAVGDGPLREAARRARAADPAARGARAHDWAALSDEELIEAYRAADVAVVPSVAVEGFGLVVLEAAACGTPSIVSDVGGLPEALAPLDPSLVVAAGDAGALGARLREAAAGALPTARPARDATPSASPGRRVAERHRALYRRLLARRAATRGRGSCISTTSRGCPAARSRCCACCPTCARVNAHVILGEDGPLAGAAAQAGVSVEVLPDRRRGARPAPQGHGAPRRRLAARRCCSTLAYVARLALRLRRLRPDLVHTNSLKAGVYGSLAARRPACRSCGTCATASPRTTCREPR